jgi:DNA-binding PadR family transcriptional regulator
MLGTNVMPGEEEEVRMRPSGKAHGEHGHGDHDHGYWSGGRIRKGDVRALMLAALLQGGAHGYELMRRLEEQAGGRWRPSPGSVYPLLQLLEDEGLIQGHDAEGRRVYELTDEGRAKADQGRLLDLAGDPSEASGHQELRDEVQRLHSAARQVGMAGSPDQVQQAVTIVSDARRSLYRLLAEQ